MDRIQVGQSRGSGGGLTGGVSNSRRPGPAGRGSVPVVSESAPPVGSWPCSWLRGRRDALLPVAQGTCGGGAARGPLTGSASALFPSWTSDNLESFF